MVMFEPSGASNDPWSGQRPTSPTGSERSLGSGEDLATPTSTTGRLGTDVTRMPDAPAPTADETTWAAGATGATGS